jgi:mono/diheme cytochrome c family protein
MRAGSVLACGEDIHPGLGSLLRAGLADWNPRRRAKRDDLSRVLAHNGRNAKEYDMRGRQFDGESRLSLLAAALVAAATADVASANDQQTPPTVSGWKSGQEVYDKVCGHCHDTGVGPVIRRRGLPPPVVTVFVRNGTRAMPAFRAAEIDDAALAQLAEFVSKN